MKRLVRYTLVVVLSCAALAPVLWQATFSTVGDPKDLRYQCWRLGLCSFDLDRAVSAMYLDQNRNDMIIGKTEPELRKRFGYLEPRDHRYPSDIWATQFDEDPGDAQLFIRKSDMMVVIKGGKAVQLRFIKGS